MTFHTTLATVLVGAGAAAGYAALVYARRRRQGEDFDRVKFAATVIVGAIWGGVMATTDQPVTPDTVAHALTAYVGVVVLTEQALKFLIDEVRNLRS